VRAKGLSPKYNQGLSYSKNRKEKNFKRGKKAIDAIFPPQKYYQERIKS
jgi:hypothetical protein